MNLIQQFLHNHETWCKIQPQGPSVTVKGKVNDAKRATKVVFSVGCGGGVFMEFKHPKYDDRDSVMVRDANSVRMKIKDVLVGEKTVHVTEAIMVSFNDRNSEFIHDWFRLVTAKR